MTSRPGPDIGLDLILRPRPAQDDTVPAGPNYPPRVEVAQAFHTLGIARARAAGNTVHVRATLLPR